MNYSSARPYAPAPLLTWGESLLLQPFYHLLHWQQPEEPSRHRNKGVNHEFLSVPDALFLKAPDYLLAVGDTRLVPKHKQSLRWWQRIFLSYSPLCSRCHTSTPQNRLKCLFTPEGPPQEKSWSLGDGQGSTGAGGPGSRGCALPRPRFGRAGLGSWAGQLGQPWEWGQAEARLGHLPMGGSGLVGHGRAALWGAGDWSCWDRDWQPWRAHMGSWAILSLLMWVVSLVFSLREDLFLSFMSWVLSSALVYPSSALAYFCFPWQEWCDSKQSPLDPPPFKSSLLTGYEQGAASLGQAYSSLALSPASVWGAEAAHALAWSSRWLPGATAA